MSCNPSKSSNGSRFADAQAFLELLELSRTGKPPRKKRGKRLPIASMDFTVSPRQVMPLLPSTSSAGVSRDDILRRMERWGVEWTREQLTKVVDELVATGDLVRGGRGLFAPNGRAH